MKAVMLSIQPKWRGLIALGKKTIEVRKTKPTIETPFKCYIYCTKDTKLHFGAGKRYSYADERSHNAFDKCGNGKVIGEFICDKVYQYSTGNLKGVDISDEEMTAGSCLTKNDLESYEFSTEPKDFCIYLLGLYGWHISDLKIYDEPRELGEFKKYNHKCHFSDLGLAIPKCSECKECQLTKPPQSWCYVERRKSNENR